MSRFLLRHDRAVQAGAGTGKTHALVTQYLHLCAGLTAQARPLEPRQIAAMTFTEKAAGEMIERIRGRAAALLLALGKGEDAAEAAEPDLFATARELGRPVPGAAHWERLLQQLGAAQVGTFHSFAGGLLRRYPALSGVDPDFIMLDEDTARDLEVEATERQVLQALEGTGGLRPEEVAPLVGEYGFRGVGGGEALVEHLCRVRARRAEEGLGPGGLAAGYDEAAVFAAFEGARGRLLHGLRRLGELGELLGEKSAALARELAGAAGPLAAALGSSAEVPAALPLLDGVLGNLGRLRGKRDDEAGAQSLSEVKATLREARRDLEAAHYTALAAPLARAFERLCGAAWAAYDEAKARLGALDFTDLLRRARDLLRDHASARAHLRERFAVVLVDECQDTNPLQAELLLLLCGAPAERGDAPGRLYVVGDRKQSIYEFRGGDVATFQALQDAIVAAGGDDETLAVSRRSRPGVLQLANSLFAQVMKVPAGGILQDLGSAATPAPLTPQALGGGSASASPSSWPSWIVQWDPERDPLLPLRPEPPVGPEGDAPAAELLLPARPEPEGGPRCENEGEGDSGGEEQAAPDPDPIGTEAQLLARHVLALREEGRRFGDMAVLLWRFTHLQRYLLALRQAGVPYYVVKGRGFYEAQEIRDLCAALTLLDDPEDVLALVSLLRSPLCALSDDSLTRLHLAGCLRLSALCRGEPPCPPELPADEAERLRAAVKLLGALAARGDRLGPAACLRAIYDGSELLPALCAGPEGPQRVANLELLLRRAEQFEEAGGGLRAFIRWLRLQCDPALPGDGMAPQAQIVSEQDDVVRVMTVHQSKGLEFPVVFIPGCAARERADASAVSYDRDVGLGLSLRRGGERHDTLPSLRVQQLRRLRAEAESARLFYVAVTRARDRVVFLGEGRRATASRGTWRGHLDALLASPDGGALAPRRIDLRAPAATPRPAGPSPDEELGAEAAARAVSRAYAAAAPAAAPTPPTPHDLPLSAAIDLALCPRRFHQRHALGLDEPPPPDEPPCPAAAEDERGPTDRLRLGTLAHRLLRRADLLGRGEDLESLLAAEGHDALQPQTAEIRTRAARLLQSQRFQDLVASGPTRRGLPFRFRIGPGLVLRGQIDLLITPPAGPATLVDLRYGYAPPRDEAEGLRRDALHAVGRAATGGPVRVALVYLREADPAPIFSDGDEAREAAALARLAAARSEGPPAAGLSALGAGPVLPIARCRSLGCGYVPRCHGDAGACPGAGPGT